MSKTNQHPENNTASALTDAEREQLEKEVAAADDEAARLLRSDPKYLRGIRPGRPDDHE
jgi:hypothetical protein